MSQSSGPETEAALDRVVGVPEDKRESEKTAIEARLREIDLAIQGALEIEAHSYREFVKPPFMFDLLKEYNDCLVFGQTLRSHRTYLEGQLQAMTVPQERTSEPETGSPSVAAQEGSVTWGTYKTFGRLCEILIFAVIFHVVVTYAGDISRLFFRN